MACMLREMFSKKLTLGIAARCLSFCTNGCSNSSAAKSTLFGASLMDRCANSASVLKTVASLPHRYAPTITQTNAFSLLCRDRVSYSNSQDTFVQSVLSKQVSLPMFQTRTYKVMVSLKRRCRGCYFVRVKNRLFRECKLKPRHKAMQLMKKRNVWKEDYSKGNVRKAMYWSWFRNQRFYWQGETSKINFKQVIKYDAEKMVQEPSKVFN